MSAMEIEPIETDLRLVERYVRGEPREKVKKGTSARCLMLPGNLDCLFARRPDLKDTAVTRLAESIRDAVVMNV